MGAPRAGERLEPAGVGVEAVGVEQQRHVGARRELAHERERALAAPGAGPEDERAGAFGASSAPSTASAVSAPSSSARPRVMTSSSRISKIISSDAGTSAVT